MKKHPFDRVFSQFSDLFRRYPVAAILSIIAGILLIVFPASVINTLICIIGVFVMIYGILCVVSLFTGSDPLTGSFINVCRLLIAIAILVVGIILTFSPGTAVGFLMLIVGIYLLIDGAVKLYRILMGSTSVLSAYGIRPATKQERIALIVAYTLTVAAGVFLIFIPGVIETFVTIFVGIALIVEGAQSLYTYYTVRKKSKKSGTYYAKTYTDKTKKSK